MRSTILAVALLAGIVGAVPAQLFDTTGAKRDCDIGRPAYDNPFSDSHGWVMPRVAWHGFNAVEGVVVYTVVRKTTHAPRWVAALVAPTAVVLLHVRGVRRGDYRWNTRDIAFDAFTRALPALYALGRREPALATVGGGLGYALLACYAQP